MVVLLLLVAWAGCVDKAAEDDVNPAKNAPAGPTTGFLRGVVVDEAIRPIEGAVVTVRQNGTEHAVLTTDIDGNFGVGKLDAGNYTLNVTKPGFLDREVSARVEAGVQIPDAIRVTLIPIPVDAAFVWPIVWNGQIACGTTLQNWCAALNLVTGVQVFNDESFRFLFDEFMAYERTPDMLQVEFVWEANTEVSKWAYAAFWASTWDEWNECLCTPNILSIEEGDQYILVKVGADVMTEFDVGFSRGVGVGVSAGSGLLDPESLDPTKLTVMVNQPFEAFMHVFYGCVPDEAWRFTTDGDPTCDPNSLAAAADAGA